MNFKNFKIFVLIIIVLAILAAGVYYLERIIPKESKKEIAKEQKTEEIQKPTKIVKEPGAEIEIKIENGTFYPTSTKVKPGEKVYLWVENPDKNEWHEFKWDKGIENVPPAIGSIGVEQKILFTFYAPKATGTYKFYCTRKEHNTDIKNNKGEIFYLIVE
jgi:plastocyanin